MSSVRSLPHPRFALGPCIGEGGFGAVYEAYDRERGTRVALKLLARMNDDALVRFRREFRALARVSHPNLVRLDELFVVDELWFFSMELVEGTDLFSWARPDGALDEARLRAALLQLARGLHAVHEAGLVHGDVKPENVRVTEAGRVVLLDFGLVEFFDVRERLSDVKPHGTIPFMAPEQGDGKAAGPPVDWYAFGVLLYELLTGVLPFEGTPFAVMTAKATQNPVPPRRVREGVPADLDALAMRLLARDPAARASFAEVLAAFGVARTSSATPERGSDDALEGAFVGRKTELSQLEQGLADTHTRGLTLVLVEGESGVGKTSLVQHFLAELEQRDDKALVLRGRCYEQEHVPYKALDGAVEELARFLSRHPNPALFMPRHGFALAQLFPVLGAVRSVQRNLVGALPGDPAALRVLAYQALFELFDRVSAERQLVLFIDDLQWVDAESVRVLRALVDADDPPPVLVVATSRPCATMEGELGVQLGQLFDHARGSRISLAGLSEQDARAVAQRLLGAESDSRRISDIVRQAHGHPMFIAEMASRRSLRPAPEVDLEEALWQRIARLSPAARTLLEWLAVAGAPVPREPLLGALHARGEDERQALEALRIARLAHTAGPKTLECAHDRIRETVTHRLPQAEQGAIHRVLAELLECVEGFDMGRVAMHFLRANEHGRAIPALLVAAERAVRALAFDRASELYGTILEHGAGVLPAKRVHEVEVALADSLASAGRPDLAARAYERALSTAEVGERARIQMRVADQLLKAARISEGLEAARRASDLVGIAWPRGKIGVISRLVFHRAVVSMRGFDAEVSPERSLDAGVAAQLDVAFTLGPPLAWAELMRSAELSARHLKLSLQTGDRAHLARALAHEANLLCMQDPAATRKFEPLLARAFELSAGDPELQAFTEYMGGLVRLFRWEIAEARRLLEASEARGVELGTRARWLLTNVRSLLGTTLFLTGELGELARRNDAWHREAHESGDKFALASLAVGFGYMRHLQEDAPERALDEIRAAMAPWLGTSDSVAAYLGSLAELNVLLYSSGDAAQRHLEAAWPQISRAYVARTRYGRASWHFFRALCALGAAANTPTIDTRLLSLAEREIAELARMSDLPFNVVRAALLRAQSRWMRGDDEGALRDFEEARAGYAARGLFCTVCDYAVGALLGGEAGAQRARSYYEHARANGFREPEKLAELLLPGVSRLGRRLSG